MNFHNVVISTPRKVEKNFGFGSGFFPPTLSTSKKLVEVIVWFHIEVSWSLFDFKKDLHKFSQVEKNWTDFFSDQIRRSFIRG